MHVSFTAPSSPEDHFTEIVSGHIRNDFPGGSVGYDRSFRDLQYDILAVSAVAAFLSAFFSILSLIFAAIAVFSKGILPFIDFHDHVAAFTAVSAVRASVCHVFFTAKADMAVSAFPGPDDDLRSVCKHSLLRMINLNNPKGFKPFRFEAFP